MSDVNVQELRAAHSNWTDRLADAPNSSWHRLETYLLNEGGWKASHVASLASESARVLRHLPDPKSDLPFQGRGLVVGYVQSGKTANYTALAARAVDAGYRMVIVLSGIHDALRRQTQVRLEQELVRNGNAEDWTVITDSVQDFRNPGREVLDKSGKFLIVVKKNVSVLRRLDEWLEAAGVALDTLPVLVIDDEADQASINTRGNRPLEPSLDSETASAAATAQGPTATNALIRSVLRRVRQAAYVAYTATPFANIFIDPDAMDAEVGQDLFPRDFALQLPRPEGYTGTEELFGVSAQNRNVFRKVSDEEIGELKQSTKRRTSAPQTARPQGNLLPESLAEAVIAFCLAGAIRDGRPSLAGKPHTMLVHVSVRVEDQSKVRGAIEDQRSYWLEALRQGHDLTAMFSEVMEKHFQGVALSVSAIDTVAAAISILTSLDVLELNSATGENLEYDERPGRHIIAVGGNRLSRGLTLEGLSVSYFLRTASMADTLLQMARWYGFRTDYEDLIRIWTTDGIAQLFTELALVEDSLRDSLQALYRAGRRPSEMAIRLRAHSAILLTARNKSNMADTHRQSWAGEHPQTVILPIADATALKSNRDLADHLVAACGAGQKTSGGTLFRDIPPEIVCEFLRTYQVHPETISMRGDAIADWIMQRVTEGELMDWSVLVASTNEGDIVDIGGTEARLVTRRLASSEGIGILIDPRHEGADLVGGADGYRRASGNYDSAAMRSARPPTQGLLLVYPLDPTPLGAAEVDAVIAIALSLPYTSDGRSSAIVNRGIGP